MPPSLLPRYRQHELFHRDKPHLISDMKRATHYGVAADKQEVEHLRSEVSRLRTHITDMGDKIGQLTSLVEALAVDRKPTAVTVGGGGGGGAGGGRDENNGGVNSSGPCSSYDSFVFGRVGVGDEFQEDVKFSHPAGLSASAVLPVQAASSGRKRKLIGLGGLLDGSGGGVGGGECFEEEGDCDLSDGDGGGDLDGDEAMAWPAGAGGVVKPEVMDEAMPSCSSPNPNDPWAPGLTTIKQEMIDTRTCRPPWTGSCSAPSKPAISGGSGGGNASSNPGDQISSSDICTAGAASAASAAASVSTVVPAPAASACSLMPPPSDMSIGADHTHPNAGSNNAGTSAGVCSDEYTLYRTDSGGFSDQFLSFGSPTSPTESYTFPDRGPSGSMASSPSNGNHIICDSRCGSAIGENGATDGGDGGNSGPKEDDGDSDDESADGGAARTNVIFTARNRSVSGVGDAMSRCVGGGSGQGRRVGADANEPVGINDNRCAVAAKAAVNASVESCGDGISAMSLVTDDVAAHHDESMSSPMMVQPQMEAEVEGAATAAAAVGGVVRLGKSHIEELRNNLESLPVESRIKVNFEFFFVSFLYRLGLF